MDINIADIVGDKKLLPVTGGRIEENKDTVAKLNSVSETISEMARSYDESSQDVFEENIQNECKKLFREELLNNIEEYESNMLYEDIIDEDDLVIDNIYDTLEKR